ncbi:phage integrase N-terminal SAM-like domain-containing protein [Pseudomonas sp. MF7453]|uniref:phage integrase N-terminal SAM-like domain-containing protein n=1 Tax=Pseudomonas sp. MF7453 TaxID=2797539 RepID=UPI0018E80578|nr:phage integrase N-terminal SAM-like domain-containing protein [Pseudomonas sp. MF7453]MBJ2221349.1 phage integrase N-terminal SAM-like domain-containing protein [Pseudomonas sp. MF7453]
MQSIFACLFLFVQTKIQHEYDIDKTRLREQFLNVIGVNHYSIRTEKTYWYWIRYFLRYHRRRHPLELGPAGVSEFLPGWPSVFTRFILELGARSYLIVPCFQTASSHP